MKKATAKKTPEPVKVEAPKPVAKAPRAPRIKAVSPPPPPNPAILAMESEILPYIKQRSEAQFQVGRAQSNLEQAQQFLRQSQAEFQRVEQEIQYRLSIINQMKGGAEMPFQPTIQPAFQPNITMQAPGMFGTPITQQAYQPQPASPSYAAAAPYPAYPAPFDPRLVPQEGFGSVPAYNKLYPDVGGDANGAITGSAEETRDKELKSGRW